MAWSNYVLEGGHKDTKPIIGGIYRHFKGGVYQVYDIIRDEASRDREIVCYKNLIYGEKWGRELSLFMSEVDAEKYPEFAGQPRMELVGLSQHLV